MNYAIWLSGENEGFSLLEKWIKEHNEISFLPHITLLGGLKKNPKEKIKQSSFAPFEIELDGVQHSDDFFKSTFLSLKPNEALTYFSQEISNLFTTPYQFNAHITLAYGKKIPVDSHIFPKKLRIEKYLLVEAKNWKDLNTWKILSS